MRTGADTESGLLVRTMIPAAQEAEAGGFHIQGLSTFNALGYIQGELDSLQGNLVKPCLTIERVWGSSSVEARFPGRQAGRRS